MFCLGCVRADGLTYLNMVMMIILTGLLESQMGSLYSCYEHLELQLFAVPN